MGVRDAVEWLPVCPGWRQLKLDLAWYCVKLYRQLAGNNTQFPLMTVFNDLQNILLFFPSSVRNKKVIHNQYLAFDEWSNKFVFASVMLGHRNVLW